MGRNRNHRHNHASHTPHSSCPIPIPTTDEVENDHEVPTLRTLPLGRGDQFLLVIDPKGQPGLLDAPLP